MEVRRSGPLTRGQEIFWLANYESSSTSGANAYLMTWEVRIPPGTSRDALQTALDRCADAFEGLRTVYPHAGTAEPRQIVLTRHSPRVVMERATDTGWLDPFEEPTFHCRVREHGGFVVRATLVANMIDMDGWSMARVARILTELISGIPFDVAARGTTTHRHPIDAAIRLDADVRQRQLARRYLETLVAERARTPRNPLPFDRPAGEAGVQNGFTAREPELMGELVVVARAANVSVSTVIQSVIGIALARWTSVERVLISSAVSNRWHRDCRDIVGRVATAVESAIDVVPHASIQDALRAAQRALLGAFRCSPVEFGEVYRVTTRADAQVGSMLVKPAFVEYLDFDDDGHTEDIPLEDRREQWQSASPSSHISFYVLPAGRNLELAMMVGEAVASRTDAARFFEDLIASLRTVSALTSGQLNAPLSAIPAPAPRSFAWNDPILWRGESYSAERMREILLVLSSVDDVAFTVVDGAAPRLVAVVRSNDADLLEVYETLLLAAQRSALVAVPQLYLRTSRSVEGVPREVEDVEHISGIDEVLDPWTAASPRVPSPEAAAVQRAFEMFNPGLAADFSRSYHVQGGDHMAVPRVVQHLRAEGLGPVDSELFLGFATLGAIARDMAVGHHRDQV